MKTWQFVSGEVQYHENGGFTWAGTVANEIRAMIYKALRDQGISVDSHGVAFVDKCVMQHLDASVQAVSNVFGEVLASKVV